MTSHSTGQRFGRVTIDDRGISQRPFLFFFGRPFDMAWSEVTAWAVADQVMHDVKTGVERVDRRILELHRLGKVDHIIRSPRDPAFQQIVDAVRQRLPDKESESLLAQLGALRQGRGGNQDPGGDN